MDTAAAPGSGRGFFFTMTSNQQILKHWESRLTGKIEREGDPLKRDTMKNTLALIRKGIDKGEDTKAKK